MDTLADLTVFETRSVADGGVCLACLIARSASSVVSAAKQTQSNLGLTPQWMSIANSNLCQVELVSSTLRREARR